MISTEDFCGFDGGFNMLSMMILIDYQKHVEQWLSTLTSIDGSVG